MKKQIVIRPKGNLYIFGVSIVIVFILVMLSASYIPYNSFFQMNAAEKSKHMYYLYVMIPFDVFLVIWLIWEIREITIYKMVLTGKELYLAANRELFHTNHKKMHVRYTDLKSMQYFLGFETIGFVSVIALEYADGEMIPLNVLKFSDKQVDLIMNYIKEFAEKENGYPIEVKADNVQKGFKRKREKNKNNPSTGAFGNERSCCYINVRGISLRKM